MSLQKTRPSGQFYVECVDGSIDPVPIDNFFWMTNRGTKLRLEMSAGRVYISNGSRWVETDSVPNGLRIMADKLEQLAKNRH